MSSLDWNVLFFIWLGAFVFVNIFTAGIVISKGKRNLPIPNCSGALIIFTFVISTLLALNFGGKYASPSFVSTAEVVFILSSAFILMLIYYFAPQNILWNRLKQGFIVALIISAFFLLKPYAFSSYSYPFWLLCIISGGFWLWFISSFKMMNKVDGLTISEGSLICFGLAFASFLSPKIPTEISVIGASLGICLLGFKSWNKFPAKITLHPSAVIPCAFVIGWLLMKSASIGLWTFAIILPLYYFIETLYAYLKSPFKPFKNGAVPFIIQLAGKDIPQNKLVSFIFRRNLILLAAALVSSGTTFGTSFLGLAIILTIYELFLLKNWGVKEPSLRELSRDFASTVKEGWKEQKLIYSAILKGKKIGLPSQEEKSEKVSKGEDKKEKEKEQKQEQKQKQKLNLTKTVKTVKKSTKTANSTAKNKAVKSTKKPTTKKTLKKTKKI